MGLTIDSRTEIIDTRTGAFIGAGIILVYGACHAAAWNTHFPSPVDRWLWRVSSIVIAVISTRFLVLVTFISDDYTGWASFLVAPITFICKQYSRVKEDMGSFSQWVWFGPLPAIVICGRVFLLVEVFISLRSLPEGSFKTPVWEDIWPHL